MRIAMNLMLLDCLLIVRLPGHIKTTVFPQEALRRRYFHINQGQIYVLPEITLRVELVREEMRMPVWVICMEILAR
jgi:hypothetical protein